MFTVLPQHISIFKNNIEEIAQNWIKQPLTRQRLLTHGINPAFFATHFGRRVIEYAIGVIEGSNEIGNCPVVHVLVEFFRGKSIEINDLYQICSGLRNTILIFSFKAKIADEAFVAELTNLMDLNFEGVILEFMSNTKKHNDDTYIIEQYQEEKTAQSQTDERFNTKKSKVSAKEFLASTKIHLDDIQELKDLEDDALESINIDILDSSHKDALISVLARYTSVLDGFDDFEDIKTSLSILCDILKQADLNKLDNDQVKKITSFWHGLIFDLRNWRESIFINSNAIDIHYMDDSLLSLIVQLQIKLSPFDLKNSDSDLELF